MYLRPPGRRKNRRNLQGKVVSAPQAEQESILGHVCWTEKIWRVEVVYVVVLACVLRATTKKVVIF